MVQKVPFVKNDWQTKSNIEHTFPTKHKILNKNVKMMLRLVFEKKQIEKLKTNLQKLYLLITTYWSYKNTMFSFI